MRCEICGMKITGEPVTEETDGEKHYYCCKGCLRYTVCSQTKHIKNFNYNY
jgi:ribosome-binding protein aMBF1 (putative translation factor)